VSATGSSGSKARPARDAFFCKKATFIDYLDVIAATLSMVVAGLR
jgi:hypothetical protein